MKLRNKQSGEIKEFVLFDGKEMQAGLTLENLAQEWEDYQEQKGNWTIDPMNENYIDDGRYTAPDELERYEELGLKFNTEEEAEKAVGKLKAWKRLENGGFEFMNCSCGYDKYTDEIGGWIRFRVNRQYYERYGDGVKKDLNLLFSQEEKNEKLKEN